MRNRAVLADAPPIELDRSSGRFSEDFSTKKVFESLKEKVKNLLDSKKAQLIELRINPIPVFASSKGIYNQASDYEDPKSYYAKIERFDGNKFYTIRVAEHENQKNLKQFTSTFFDISGNNEETVDYSVEKCINTLRIKIEREIRKHSIIAEIVNLTFRQSIL